MAPSIPIKRYTLASPNNAWSSQHLELHHNGLPILYINTNNKFGPWKSPYVTLQQHTPTGEIVAAAKMGYPGCARSFRVWLGNPDCTDLEQWPVVRCRGTWAGEYRFCVQGSGEAWEFAWRRTRDGGLGAGGRGRRDFKLICVQSPGCGGRGEEKEKEVDIEEKRLERLVDIDDDDDGVYEDGEGVRTTVGEPELLGRNERVVAVYLHQGLLKKGCSRAARIDWFEELPADVELWCLAAVMGLQEKITTNKQALAVGYYGTLSPLGSFF